MYHSCRCLDRRWWRRRNCEEIVWLNSFFIPLVQPMKSYLFGLSALMLSSLATYLHSCLWQHLLTVVNSAWAYLSTHLITVICGICVKQSWCLIRAKIINKHILNSRILYVINRGCSLLHLCLLSFIPGCHQFLTFTFGSSISQLICLPYACPSPSHSLDLNSLFWANGRTIYTSCL